MRLLAGLVALGLALTPALGADMVVKAPRFVEPSANPCGDQGSVNVRLVEGRFFARTVRGQTHWVDDPDTVMIVCADGRVFYTQVSQSILPFNPEIAAVVGPELAVLAAAAAAAAIVVAAQQEDKPVSP